MSKRRKYLCACGHSLAFHDPDEHRCHQSVRAPKSHVDQKDWSPTPNLYDRVVVYEDVECRCRQYVGRLPKGWGESRGALEAVR